jgi:hypothetical protein
MTVCRVSHSRRVMLSGVFCVTLLGLSAPVQAQTPPVQVKSPHVQVKKLPVKTKKTHSRAKSRSIGWFPGLRTGFGSTWGVGGKDGSGFTFDLHARVTIGKSIFRGQGLNIEPLLGYTHIAMEQPIDLFLAGLSIDYGFGGGLVNVGLGSYYQVGTAGDDFAHGVRNVLSLEFFFKILRFETGHHALWQEGNANHGMNFMVGLDVLRIMSFVGLVRTLSRW